MFLSCLPVCVNFYDHTFIISLLRAIILVWRVDVAGQGSNFSLWSVCKWYCFYFVYRQTNLGCEQVVYEVDFEVF